MLPNTLVTNEVKNASGVEQEFARQKEEGPSVQFVHKTAAPNLPHYIRFSHREVGKDAELRRQSVREVVKTVIGVSGVQRKVIDRHTTDFPIGDLADMTEPKNVMAEGGSLDYTLTGTATFLYDGTGNGSSALLEGSI
jgi:hypothetical protein